MKGFLAVALGIILIALECTSAAAMPVTYWQDSFESGDFSKWSYVQGADPSQGGPGPQYVYVTNPTAAGIPAENGTHVAHFQVPLADQNTFPHAKVYKEWTVTGKKDQFQRVEDTIFGGGNVSAIYTAWYYFPKDYVASTDWVDIFFFKEEGYATTQDKDAGGYSDNPSWWLNVAPSDTFGIAGKPYPVLFANNNGNPYINFRPKTITLPLGQWFKISANLHWFSKGNPDNRIDWYLNGKMFDTSRGSVYPVGRFYDTSNGWCWGVGHYLGVGQIWIDNISVTSLQ